MPRDPNLYEKDVQTQAKVLEELKAIRQLLETSLTAQAATQQAYAKLTSSLDDKFAALLKAQGSQTTLWGEIRDNLQYTVAALGTRSESGSK
jgi:hypothetical protein